MLQAKVYIIDTTLRDGEQTPGLAFSHGEKLRIAESLEQLGVQEVEAGTPAIGKAEQDAIKDISRAGFSFKTSCWCRAKPPDIIQASKLGTQAVNISLPVSDIQISTLGKSREWVLEQLPGILSLAKQYFPHVTMGAQDASRAVPDFLNTFIQLAASSGADRIRIADTVGILDPMEAFELMKNVVGTYPEQEFEFHGHNDFGFATANAIMAVKAGTQCLSATVNGLGERAGNSALEEIIAYLSYKMGDVRFRTGEIYNLCSLVAGMARAQIPDTKAITGRNAFRHESGIHTAAILKNPRSYQILDASDFGVPPLSFAFGKHSGKNALHQFFESRSLPLTEQLAFRLNEQVKAADGDSRRPFSEKDLIRRYHEALEITQIRDFR